MKKTICSFFMLVLWAGYCTAQIHLPDAHPVQNGLLTPGKFDSKSIKHASEGKLVQWHTLPSPSDAQVTQVSLASDGSDMVIFYREPDYSLNIDRGPIKKWNRNTWDVFAGATNQCHDPDIDIADGVVVATWNDDSYDYGYGTNINGPWVNMTGTYLMKQWYPRAAMAMGLPYMSFSCRYSDGMPVSNMMLHIKHIVGPGADIELNGGWRFPYYDVDMKTDLTGDENAWYCAYTQQGYVLVDKGSLEQGVKSYTDLGDGFRMGAEATAYNPAITLLGGMPVVAWLENSGSEIYVAKWIGEWQLIGSVILSEGTATRIRMTSMSMQFSTYLYVMYLIDNAEQNISVNRFDGSNWYEYPSVQDKFNTNISTADIALYNSEPVVAYTQDNLLSVKIYTDNSPVNGEIDIVDNHTMKCYPNPMNEYFSVDLGKTYPEIQYEMLSITGTRLIRKEFKFAASIHDSFIAPPGIYILEIFSENNKIATFRLLKTPE